MSAPIYTLLAEELDISEDRARKLLTAMLREVKKRAHRQGVRVPSLGTFREKEGDLIFEPADSLARVVNQRFEGLQDENLARQDADAPQETREQEGPSTITLGYEANDWSPIESAESDGDSPQPANSAEPDTEEFQVLSSDDAPDTEELHVEETHGEERQATQTEEGSSSEDTSSTDTEELYPLVEDVPGTSSTEPQKEESSAEDTASEEPDTGNGLEDIWSSELESSSETPQDSADSSPPSSPETGVSSEPSPTPEDSETSTTSFLTSPILIAPLVLLLVGSGWYFLGQRNLLPSPSTTLSGLTAQIQQQTENLPLLKSSPATPSDDEETDTTLSSSLASNTEELQSNDTEDPERSNEEERDATSVDPSSEPTSTMEIDPSEGGWTIIVASRTNRPAADTLVATFRNQFENLSLPIDIVVGEAENTTRYRVAVGQFRTQTEVMQAIDEYEDSLPEGAWPLNLR